MSEEGGAAPSAEVVEPSVALRDIRGGAEPRVAALEAVPEPPAPVIETTEPAPKEGGLDPADIEALSGDLSKPPEGDVPMVKIGDVEFPLAQLVEHLSGEAGDDILGAIKRTVRAAGEDREVSLLDALAAVPKAEGWQKRQWQAAQHEKKLDGIAQSISTDVVGAYAQLHGLTQAQAADAVAEQVLAIHERSLMTPEDRAKADAQAELEQKAAAHDEIKRQQITEREAAATKAYRKRITPEIYRALKEAGVPKSRHALQQTADIVYAQLENGVIRGEPTSEDYAVAAQQVATERSEDRAVRYDGLEGDDLIERMGPELSRRVAKAVAKRYQRNAPVRLAPSGTKGASAKAARPPEESMGEWKRRRDKEMQGR